MAGGKVIKVLDHRTRVAGDYDDSDAAQIRDRLSREAERELTRMRGELLAELLEVLDNFDRSLAALPADANDGIREGLVLVREQFFATLAHQGLEEVPALGEPFDPTVHEAVCTEAVSDPRQCKQILAVIKAGYRLGSTLIRPALVQVGTGDGPPKCEKS